MAILPRRLIGGLLNRIVPAQATSALPLERYDGAVLFREEMGSQAPHIWSYLQVLRHSGILDRISGMVVGIPCHIGGLGAPDGSPTLPEIVLDVLGDRDIPVLGNVGSDTPARTCRCRSASRVGRRDGLFLCRDGFLCLRTRVERPTALGNTRHALGR
ncbi:hypothetical protein OG948_02555 [Embleya sp. NBC_00888]|uniref:hypothetical protein n=1 Tax=Embleya sp. NBC_00888 TaxID=2975960 RepID=UPI003867D798|nr:hypothetical protein OG948_02555 [Embleya sp. NBC_00888]